MVITTVTAFLDSVSQYRLLEQEQQQELERNSLTGDSDPKALARELVRRGLLTPYQVNQLFLGRGHELLLGSYVLLEKLGAGGMGTVFKARNWKLRTVVALKLIRQECLQNPGAVQRFQREIRVAAQLNHPHIIRAFDADLVNDTHFFVMEYAEGTDLGKLVRKQGQLPVDLACNYTCQAALGLQHAFECGLVHRDIKPANLLLTQLGIIKILDMGLARLPPTVSEDTGTPLTVYGTVLGTPDYLAPEQSLNAHMADIRCDLYSLGCTLYFLLCAQVPFPGTSVTEKLVRHSLEDATPVEQLRPDVPAAVAAVVRRLMAKSPEERFQTPIEVVVALEEAAGLVVGKQSLPEHQESASGTPVSASQDTPCKMDAPTEAGFVIRPTAPSPESEPVSRRGPPRRVTPWVFAGLAGAALLGLAALFLFWPREPAGEKDDGPTPPDKIATNTALPPLDQLHHTQISAYEESVAGGGKHATMPPALVAILGNSRLKHYDHVSVVGYSSDGKVLVTSSADGTVKLWDPATGNELRSWEATARALSRDGRTLALGTAEGRIQVWDVVADKEVCSFATLQGRISALALTAAGQMVACSGSALPGTVKLWELPSGTEKRIVPGSPLAFSPDGQTLACLVGKTLLNVYWVTTGVQRFSLLVLADASALFSPDGLTLATWGPGDPTVKLCDATTGKVRQSFPAHGSHVYQLTFSPDGKMLATFGHDGVLRLWDAASVQKIREIGSVWSGGLAFSPDGKTVASGNGARVTFWDVGTGAEQKPELSLQGLVNWLALSPDESKLVLVEGDGTVRLWDIGTDPEALRILGSPGPGVRVLALSPNSQYLAAADPKKGTLTVWDLGLGKELYRCEGYDAAFSPDGDHLAVVVLLPQERALRVLETATGKEHHLVKGLGERLVSPTAFSPDGKIVALAVGPDVRLVDTTTGRQRCVFPTGGLRAVEHLLFSPDGKILACTTDYADKVFLWDVASCTTLRQVRGVGYSPPLAFSPDSRTLATSAKQGTVRRFDVRTGNELTPLKVGPPGGLVRQIVYSADGRHLIILNGNHTVSILRLAPRGKTGRS